MTTLQPLDLTGIVEFEGAASTTRWYGWSEPFRDVDGNTADFVNWSDKRLGPVGDGDPDFCCDVTTSGIFSGDSSDLYQEIRSALVRHTPK